MRVTVKQLCSAEEPAEAFVEYAKEDPEGAKELYESEGGSTKLAEKLGYSGKRKRTVARKFRKTVGTPDKDSPRRFKTEVENDQQGIQEQIAKLLTTQKNRETPFSIADLCETVDRGPSTVRAAIESLRDQGIGIHLTEDDRVTIPLVAESNYKDVDIDFFGDGMRFGLISDTHLGSKFAAHDILEAAYDYYAEEGIRDVFHCGDMNEGAGNLGYRGHASDVHSSCQDWIGQEEFTHEYYPCRDGVRTYFISSSKSHCGWHWISNGRDICRDIADGRPEVRSPVLSRFGYRDVVVVNELCARDDLVYLGQDRHDVLIGPERSIRMRLFHPDGGSAYALSYRPQKIVEALPGGTKPHILAIGHYHQFLQTRFRNISVICVPGMQWETPLFRRWGKEPVVGALVCNVKVDKNGSLRNVVIEDLIHYYEPEGVYND